MLAAGETRSMEESGLPPYLIPMGIRVSLKAKATVAVSCLFNRANVGLAFLLSLVAEVLSLSSALCLTTYLTCQC